MLCPIKRKADYLWELYVRTKMFNCKIGPFATEQSEPKKTPLLYFLLSLVVRKLSQIHFESLNNNFGSSAVCTLISLGSCFVLQEILGSFI